jgi:enamine deaminase RidA (YjgF/YER057c/UK114 family)
MTSPQHDSTVRRRIFDDTTYEEEIGYARAVVTGPWIHIAGTTGIDYPTYELPEQIVPQAAQCFKNVERTLERAGAKWDDVVVVRYILARAEDFQPCWPIFREHLGHVRPAATMYVAELADPRALFELEVTAYIDRGCADAVHGGLEADATQD